MQSPNILYILNKPALLLLFFALTFLCRKSLAQEIPDTPIEHYVVYKNPADYKNFPVNGRVLGVNLENVQGVTVTNRRTAEKANTDSRGLYKINAAKGDTLIFEIAKYSKERRTLKSVKDNLNIILIKRKTDGLPSDRSESDYDKANKEDEELYRILEKDAKLEGKWNY